MRFMMLMIPKGYESATPGTMPDADAVAAMMKYNEALQKAESIADPQHLLAWGRQVAKLKAFNYLKRQKHHPRPIDPELLDVLEPVWQAESQASGPSMMEALNECMQELTPRSRKLVDLRFGDRLSGSQMSQALGLKVPSVYMALSRVYRILDKCVRRKLAEAG